MDQTTQNLFVQLQHVKPDEMVKLATAMAEAASSAIRKVEDSDRQFLLASYRDAWYLVARHA